MSEKRRRSSFFGGPGVGGLALAAGVVLCAAQAFALTFQSETFYGTAAAAALPAAWRVS